VVDEVGAAGRDVGTDDDIVVVEAADVVRGLAGGKELAFSEEKKSLYQS
jgi:hypothetical protein